MIPHEINDIFAEGVLEVMPDGHGFLRSPDYNFLPSPDDIYVAASLINRFNLKTGDLFAGSVRIPEAGITHFSLIDISAVNSEPPNKAGQRTDFHLLSRVEPCHRLKMETTRENLCGRILDLIVPLGKGMSCSISGPPHMGKMAVIENIATSLAFNHSGVTVIVLLIEADPVEAETMTRYLRANVFFSSVRESDARHIHLTQIVVERAKRIVETGQDVVLVIDSLSRLVEAYNAVLPDNAAMEMGAKDPGLSRGQRLLESAVAAQNGGSLTVIGTVDTWDQRDKTVEAMEEAADALIVLDKRVFEDGVFPPGNIQRSRSKKSAKVLSKEDHARGLVLQKVLSPLSPTEGIKLLASKLIRTRSNDEFYSNMSSL